MNALLSNDKLPRLIAVVLALALAWQVVYWWRASTSTAGHAISGDRVNGALDARATGGGPASDDGLAFPLFGISAQQQPGGAALPATTLGLVLRGVLALGDGRGYAMIDTGSARPPNSAPGASVSDAADGLFAVGEPIVGRVKLFRVYRDHVVLQTAHGLESLALQGDKIKASATHARSPLAPAPRVRMGARKAVLNSVQSQKVVQVLHDPMQFRHYVRVVPVHRDGRQLGYQVAPAGDPRLFSALGLHAGDVITRVNGKPLDGSALHTFELFKDLHGAHEISLRVLRNGHEIPLHVELQGR